jgi:hypothetical protein
MGETSGAIRRNPTAPAPGTKTGTPCSVASENSVYSYSRCHTCELYGANPFDYLAQLQGYAGELARNPSRQMPRNYPATHPAPVSTPARVE